MIKISEIQINKYRNLNNINLVFSEKTKTPIYLIYGANGSGKSNLLYLIFALFTPEMDLLRLQDFAIDFEAKIKFIYKYSDEEGELNCRFFISEDKKIDGAFLVKKLSDKLFLYFTISNFSIPEIIIEFTHLCHSVALASYKFTPLKPYKKELYYQHMFWNYVLDSKGLNDLIIQDDLARTGMRRLREAKAIRSSEYLFLSSSICNLSLEQFIDNYELINTKTEQILFKDVNLGLSLELEDLSGGELKLIGLWTWMRYLSSNSIVFLDDLEISLSFKSQIKLLEKLQIINCQFLIATHSDNFATKLSPNNCLNLN